MFFSYFSLYAILKANEFIKMCRRRRYVNQIKTIKFRKNKTTVEEDPTCSICLCEYEEDEEVKKLRCGHFFHSECIDTWLINKKALCPICRQGIYSVDNWV